MSTYGYVRVSSESQVRDGQGLSIQRDKILAYAFARGLDPVEFLTDPAESGATPLDERPGGRELCSVLRSGDAVIMASLDRAWRSVIDAEGTLCKWRDQGVLVHIINFPVDLSSPMGRLVFQILTAVAEFERTLIGERIRCGVRAAIVARGGQWGPKAPYGWAWPDVPGDPLVPVPAEQEIVRVARALREGGMSFYAVAGGLNARAYLSRNAQPWTRSSVRRILQPHRQQPPAGG